VGAFNDSLKTTIKFRMMAEEIAGLRDDPRLTAPRVLDSPPPTITVSPHSLVIECDDLTDSPIHRRAKESLDNLFSVRPPPSWWHPGSQEARTGPTETFGD
jgi:hypothetical protein